MKISRSPSRRLPQHKPRPPPQLESRYTRWEVPHPGACEAVALPGPPPLRASYTLPRRSPWLSELQVVVRLPQLHPDLGVGPLPGLLRAPRRPKAAKAPQRQPPAADLPPEPGGKHRGGRERVIVASPGRPPSALGEAFRAAPPLATS